LKKALIINYHQITQKDDKTNTFGRIYSITQKNFELQMKALKNCNIKVASLHEIIENKIDEEFCVALTIDDCNISDFNIVFPLLKQFGYTATFFLSTQNVGKNGVTWEQYRQIAVQGFDIGSHGISHRDLTLINYNEINIELEQSKNIIENNINKSISLFSLPFGMYNSKIKKMAYNIGYKAILTTQFNFTYPSKKPFVIKRWSVKMNTSIKDFRNIIQNNKFTIQKYIYTSAIKKKILYFFGSSIINKVNTFTNKYFLSL